MARMIAHDDAMIDADAIEPLGRLIYQFLPMGKKQNAIPAGNRRANHRGRNGRLAAASGQDIDDAPPPCSELLPDGLDARLLVWAEGLRPAAPTPRAAHHHTP
jgi:hypothetical protein